jgi:ribosomal protein L11 methyltransferase
MAWLQLRIRAPHQFVETVEDLLFAHQAVSVTLEDAADQPLLEPGPGETPIWDDVEVVGLFVAEDTDPDILRASLDAQLPGECGQVQFEDLPERDWVRAWMDRFQPMRFGERLWIVPSHLAPPDPTAVNLLLDPGLAFGTGTHPTTALCLQWLDANPPKELRVLDYGAGSGVLALASAKLGASDVIAIDNDPQAVTASHDNATRNQVTITAGLPDSLAATEVFDVVLANILASILIQLAPTLTAHCKVGGRLVLSGILVDQADDVMAAFPNFEFAPIAQQEDWVRLDALRLR